MTSMKDLITQIAKTITTKPDQVVVREIEGTDTTIFELSVSPDDMGRVIGKRGRTANAMRTLLRIAAIKENKRVSLEIV